MDRLEGARELLDGPLEPVLLAGNLRDLARINRLLGGARLSWRALRAVARAADRRLTLLDVGTGAADIPRHLLAQAERDGVELAITATEVRPEILHHARAVAEGTGRLHLEIGEADRLAYPDDSFDIVHASLVLHHLEPPEAAGLLAEMCRVARRAVIVNDLDRARRWWLGAWLLTRLTTANAYTRHDAPLSVRRAYTPDEASSIAAAAGLRELTRLRDRLGHRYALVLEPGR
ncbi:MAG TPA: methyltransferase domain-containing protein [Candidatus Limnocylindrales bacterium]|nr:methyltransferase domain-containing protein [Candidatus Limnocylindrales bacterium]